jgi:hypothetical protein
MENNMTIADQFSNSHKIGERLDSTEILRMPTFYSWTKGKPDADGVRTDIVAFTDGSEIEITGRIPVDEPFPRAAAAGK